jgi:glyoxylase-like metal-dependent hydrolase (beta-lactamase superfamily II)
MRRQDGRVDSAWSEVAASVFVRRYATLDQTLGLVVGEERCLAVDTGRDEIHGAELAAAIRSITSLPWTAMITHAHWDHFFGTASFLPCSVWAHERCRDVVANRAEEMRDRGLGYYAENHDPTSAAALRTAQPIPPSEVFADQVVIDLGGRSVVLRHLGRGHTDNDVVAEVTDEAVVFAGDLVEQGAPPAIGADAYPAEWPATLDRLLALKPEVVVAGHGRPVDATFVRTQRDELAVVADLIRAVAASELSEAEAVARSPYPPDATMPALENAVRSQQSQPTMP